MPSGFAEAWAKIEGMLHGVIASLPNLGVALLVCGLCYGAGRVVKALIIRVTDRRRRHRNLGVVLGRLAQWGIGFVGLLVAFSIVLPSFKAGDLIQLLGIGSVAAVLGTLIEARTSKHADGAVPDAEGGR